LSLDLDRIFDFHQILARTLVFHAQQLAAKANSRTSLDRRNEPYPVKAIVEGGLQVLRENAHVLTHPPDTPQGEVAMRDRAAERALPPRTLCVAMNPLAVSGAFGELIDHRLVDLNPFRDAKLLSDHPAQLFE